MLELSEQKQKILEKLAQKYSLELLLLFGSQMGGKIHKDSDYDVAYLSTRDFARLRVYAFKLTSS